MTQPFFQEAFVDCMLGIADLRDVLPPYLQAWGWPGTADELIEKWLEVENAPDERVLAAIRTLAMTGIACCLATSQERLRAAYMREVMGFNQLFDEMFFSCEVGSIKPDPAFYNHITAALHVAGDQILFWDDSRENVEAARSCGWLAEQYTDYEPFKVRLADYLPAETVAELP
jgi:putative hydrolase of the HAD superfamily